MCYSFVLVIVFLFRKHVVFGTLLDGMYVLDRIEKVTTKAEDKPKFDVTIDDCMWRSIAKQ